MHWYRRLSCDDEQESKTKSKITSKNSVVWLCLGGDVRTSPHEAVAACAPPQTGVSEVTRYADGVSLHVSATDPVPLAAEAAEALSHGTEPEDEPSVRHPQDARPQERERLRGRPYEFLLSSA